MNVYLYTFSKKLNSTARPSGGANYDGVLRDNCNTLSPSIGFDFGQSASPAALNYAYIADFGARYYYVDSWTWDGGLWYANMTVDVLATYKTEIGGSTNYILRAAGAYNGDIVDNMYPVTGYHTSTSVDIIQSFSGCYIVGIVAGAAGVNGAVSYLQFSAAEFVTFASALLDTITWTGQTFDVNTGLSDDGLTETTFKALFNPAQYIQSCKWMPFTPTQPGSLSDVPLGWWSVTGATCHPVSQRTYTQPYSVTLPTHPQSSGRGNYLNLEPYTRYTLKIQPFGNFVIDTSRVSQSHAIDIYITADVESGIGILEVFSQDGGVNKDLLIYAEKKISVDIALAQQSQDVFSAITSIAEGAAGVLGSAVTLSPAGVISNGTSGILGAMSAFAPRVQVLGSSGSFASYGTNSFLTADFNTVVPEDTTTLGKPLCDARQLSTLSGYQLIANPEISIAGSSSEAQEIISYLSNGYFYE